MRFQCLDQPVQPSQPCSQEVLLRQQAAVACSVRHEQCHAHVLFACRGTSSTQACDMPTMLPQVEGHAGGLSLCFVSLPCRQMHKVFLAQCWQSDSAASDTAVQQQGPANALSKSERQHWVLLCVQANADAETEILGPHQNPASKRAARQLMISCHHIVSVCPAGKCKSCHPRRPLCHPVCYPRQRLYWRHIAPLSTMTCPAKFMGYQLARTAA